MLSLQIAAGVAFLPSESAASASLLTRSRVLAENVTRTSRLRRDSAGGFLPISVMVAGTRSRSVLFRTLMSELLVGLHAGAAGEFRCRRGWGLVRLRVSVIVADQHCIGVVMTGWSPVTRVRHRLRHRFPVRPRQDGAAFALKTAGATFTAAHWPG